MAERDPSHSDARAAGTLLGVPAPRVESKVDSPLRSPVFVRSGTSIADSDAEPPPLPRMALPSRPLIIESDVASERGASARFAAQGGFGAWLLAFLQLPVQGAGKLLLWMLLLPALVVWLGLMSLLVSVKGPPVAPVERVATTSSVSVPEPSAPAAKAVAEKPAPRLAELSGKPLDTLSSKELVLLAEGRADDQRTAVKALRAKLEDNPKALQDKAVQTQLLHFVSDSETSREALSAMAAADAPLGPDLLYEVWTGTTQRTDATDLARALVYSTDLRPKASPALAVALELRVADKCESYKAILPKALKDGDRRALHLLVKLNAKRGCGPKKADDCYVCLRDDADELTATINAVKSRRPPSYGAP